MTIIETQRQKRKPTANSRLPQWGLTWLNQVQCFYQHLCLVDSEVLRNPPLRQAAKRYRQAKKTTVRRLLAVICAKFAEKVLFAENK
jgi:hypothetical protein